MASASPKVPPLPVLRAVDRLRTGLAALHRRLVPGHVALREMQMAGFLAQAVSAAATLGIADALATGPRQPADLARMIGANEDGVRRLMRLLISYDVFEQRADGRYALTRISQGLRSDSAVSLRDLFQFFGSDYHRGHWSHLAEAVRTGRPVAPDLDGMTFFEYTALHRDIGDLFDRAMTSVGNLSIAPLLAAYDFGRFPTIVDIGAGHGSLLIEILRHTEAARGIIFDLPEVVAGLADRIAEHELTDCLAVETGSFFDTAPKGGDAYILKHIIHDWSDAEAEQILRTVRAAMDPEASVLLIEMVLPAHRRPHASKFIDLEMLVNATGRERTRDEYGNLLARSGFALTRLVPTASADSILEARPLR
ncbi:methyltransferase [Nocardia huaxiensis]|uniref:Hydroxyneurosporene methyltransferase n=1 Tax=Nocardia huaxiensis TaxID=2755382 RepID=A0A7D6VAB3_9NOCA|nr:methyltransferase [Nocardia huaxiensis]QLY30231.1 hydroxyneurosporene methyltransferase [Nocardia huaxiensis]UFS96150.1 acetylserotonin O-methyltransferase [Nocardia huaxiensis]